MYESSQKDVSSDLLYQNEEILEVENILEE